MNDGNTYSPTQNVGSSSFSGSVLCRNQTPRLLTILDVVACLLSVCCIAVYFYSRWQDPRRRAERAARHEERRNRRAYRCLARKQAFKNWWNRRMSRNNDDGRIRDYEEKRTMINAQEAVLEIAMQEEIRQLREAEEGLTGDGGTDSGSVRGGPSTYGRRGRTRTYSRPPTYRSRASSGRPPSYNDSDARGSRGTMQRHEYIPGATTATSSPTDYTPDSSVISLSPRHSFDTLKTESVVM